MNYLLKTLDQETMKSKHGSRNKSEGETALEILAAYDFKVQQFSEYHFRINDRLDVWPVSRKYYDIRLGRKGLYPKNSLSSFVKDYFKEELVGIFVTL